MKNSEKNRCPIKAKKRATADLRCAARKLGIDEAIKLLRAMKKEEAAKKGGK